MQTIEEVRRQDDESKLSWPSLVSSQCFLADSIPATIPHMSSNWPPFPVAFLPSIFLLRIEDGNSKLL